MLWSTFPKIFLQTYSLSLRLPSHAPHCSFGKGKVKWTINLDQYISILFLYSFILQTFLTCIQSLNLFVQHPQHLKSLKFLTLYCHCCLNKNIKYILHIIVALSKLLSQRLQTTGRQELFLWERIIFHHFCWPYLQRIRKGTGAKENCKWSSRFIVKTYSSI